MSDLAFAVTRKRQSMVASHNTPVLVVSSCKRNDVSSQRNPVVELLNCIDCFGISI